MSFEVPGLGHIQDQSLDPVENTRRPDQAIMHWLNSRVRTGRQP